MKAITQTAAATLALSLGLVACVPASAPPPAPTQPVATRPAPRPAPAPPPVVQPPVMSNWMDVPATPGNWEFAAFPFGSQAIFRGPSGPASGFSIACNAQSRQILLLRLGAGDRPLPMRVLTETASRAGLAEPALEQFAGVVLRLAPNDPLLDAMALSKGRFAVEVEGLPPLYLPSYAEVSRVIEDCRG